MSQRNLVWSCDYCLFYYHEKSETDVPYLEIVGKGRSEDPICEVGRGEEFADYDVSTKQEAIESGLDVMHLYEVQITYAGKSDEDFDCEYGEYGSDPKWLSRQ